MVSIFIVILIVGGFAGNSSFFATTRQDLEADIDQIRRSVRFSRDEAILRGRIVRLYIDLDTIPQTMKVEFADESDFIIPSFLSDPDTIDDTFENKELEKKQKRFEQAFTSVTEFSDGPLEFNENIVIRVIGSTLMDNVFTNGQISLFFYPSGEKDGGFFLISTEEEMATVSYGPFTEEINEEFLMIEGDISDPEALERYFSDKGKELFNAWERE